MKTQTKTLKKTKYSVYYFVRNGEKVVKQHRDFIQKRTAIQGFFKTKLKFGENLEEVYIIDNETGLIDAEHNEKKAEKPKKTKKQS